MLLRKEDLSFRIGNTFLSEKLRRTGCICSNWRRQCFYPSCACSFPSTKGPFSLVLIALLLLVAAAVYTTFDGNEIYASVDPRTEGLEASQAPRGPSGPYGPAVLGFYQVDDYKYCGTDTESCQLHPTCESGDIATGGGYILSGPGLYVKENRPYGDDRWYVTVVKTIGSTCYFTAYVICADIP